MKKLITLIFSLSIILIAQAQVSKTINVTTAGTLSTLLTATEKSTVTNLTVTGNIDARDVKCIRDSIINLTELDITNVTILEYNGHEGTSYPNPFDYNLTITHYPANELPTQALACRKYLKSLKLPNSITSIEFGAMQICPELTSIVIPNQVKTIVGETFTNCTKLSSVTMSNSVTTLGQSVFAGCVQMTDLTLSDSLKSIGSSVFMSIALNSIKIPSSVRFIGTMAFSSSSFTSIYSYPTVPVDLTSSISVFSDINKSTCTLYVPKGSKALYQAANQWQDFTNIIEMTTAVPTLLDTKVNLYPNPMTESFQINGVEGTSTVSVSDLNGKILFKKQVIGNENVSVGTLTKGMYIAKIITTEGTIERKIIKE